MDDDGVSNPYRRSIVKQPVGVACAIDPYCGCVSAVVECGRVIMAPSGSVQSGGQTEKQSNNNIRRQNKINRKKTDKGECDTTRYMNCVCALVCAMFESIFGWFVIKSVLAFSRGTNHDTH